MRVRCQINRDGLVASAAIAVSSGYKLLDEEALRTVRKWRFKPAENMGVPVAGAVVVPVQFRLH